MNKRKIINDPVYGFITIHHGIFFDLIEHPYVQRLRRIKQVGMSHYVYPGAIHTRFHHALGALHLTQLAIKELRSKGHEITDEEELGVGVAILLHDIGHGPYSHSLERCLVKGVSHEFLSELIMQKLNLEMGGKLDTAISIFKDEYPKRFLHQLVSSQLDMDRMDYLKRDSFFTGVQEGTIAFDRIIHMLEVCDDRLVVEAKGIYSVEKFLVARRLMYWQVYLHKTVVCAEQILIKILERAKELAHQGVELFATPALHFFLYQDYSKDDFAGNDEILRQFLLLDDYDVFASIKVWASHTDKVLSTLCSGLVNRRLFKIKMSSEHVKKEDLLALRQQAQKEYSLSPEEAAYFVFEGSTSNSAYNMEQSTIDILHKDGRLEDVAQASDQLNIKYLSQPVTKYYLCYPKGLNS